MPGNKLLRSALSLGAIAAVAVAAGCNSDTVTSPSSRGLKPAFGVIGGTGTLRICKTAPWSGQYSFKFIVNNVFAYTVPITLPAGGGTACLDNAITTNDIETLIVEEMDVPSDGHVAWQLNLADGTPLGSQDGGNSYTFTFCNDKAYELDVTDSEIDIPQGKTFTIGPSSMEGHLTIHAGDFFNGGYSFKFKSSTHIATQFSVASFVDVPVTCPQGGGAGGTIHIDLGTRVYSVPAGNTNWLPTGDANSILSWQGVVVTPDLCNGFPMDNAKGAIYTATVSQNPATGSLVDFRFKYRDPAAKGKPNTNCLDATDPNRNRADVCGASWSQTVTDP